MLLPLKRKLRKNRGVRVFLSRIYGLYWNIPMGVARLFRGIDPNLVTFSAFEGLSYCDSPRCISEALHAARPETRIAWLFENVEDARAKYDIPDYVRVCDANRLSGMAALARARVIVDNTRKHFYINVPGRKQEYIQTWHGDRPFKVIGYDNPFNIIMLEEKCTLVLSGSDFGERILRSAFHYKGEVMNLGCPRNDMLVRNDPAERAKVRAGLGLDEDCGALLYAPTFRDVERRASQSHRARMDLQHTLDVLERTTGKKWKCLVRAHYLSFGISAEDASDRLLPVSDYPEMAELMIASDALLTDYSSLASDFVLLKRPIYLYQDDVEEYENKNRGFYLPMSDYDYWIAHTPEELDALIERTTPERTAENCEKLIDFYGMHETGRSTEAAVKYIVSKLK